MNLIYATLGFIGGVYVYVSLVSLLWEGGMDRKLVARMQRRMGPPRCSSPSTTS